MHDQTELTIGRVRRVLRERIWPAGHSYGVPVDLAAHHLPGEPIPPDEGLSLAYEPFAVGTSWGPAWGTTWFRLRGTIPREWAGRRVEVLMDLGFDPDLTGFQCEGLVYRGDGSPVKGLNPRNQWVLAAEPALGGERVELYVEAAANPVLLHEHPFAPTAEGSPRTSSERPLYAVRRAEMACVEPEVHELALDLDVLFDLQSELPAGARRAQILQALDDALDALDLRDIAGTAAAARAALAPVLVRPAAASAHRISAIGHSHIDSAWLWPVRETIRKVARTTSSMAALLDEDPDFVYGMSSAQQYAWMRDHRPEVFERIRAAVAAGRFVPLGGMWVESDTVMPSGESLVRQFLYGQRFFESEFGIRCRGVWLPDSFGYSPALPQLIVRSGFDWFFTQKISWNQDNVFPHHTFSWEGIDGSRVLTHFPPMDTYTAELSGAEVAKADRQFRDARHATGSIAPVGWGDGGGGTTREMTGRARRLADLEGSPTVVWERPDDFFDRTRAEVSDPPVWVGELYLELHRATLTSQHATKQGNRRAEQALVEAELWCATASVRRGAEYPLAELDSLWQRALLLQFHDILPGTSIAWVHEEAVAEFAGILAGAEALIEAALRILTGPGHARITANPAPLAAGGVEPGGATVDVGRTERHTGRRPVTLTTADDGVVLDNGIVRIALSERGWVRSAVDLATGRDAIAPGAFGNVLQVHEDYPNAWDAWDVDRFYRNRVRTIEELRMVGAEVRDDGVARVEVAGRISPASTVRQVLTLAPGERVLRIEQDTVWREVETFLKVAFPLDVRADYVSAETQFGHVRRPTHTNTSWEAAKFETSMHRFVHVEEPGFGVGLVNDSSYGYDLTRGVVDARVTTTVRLSLLRAPRFPDPETDQGPHRHVVGLVVGVGVAGALAAGIALNTPVRVRTGGHGFEPLVTVAGRGILVSAVKLAADGSGDVVVRIHEALGARATGTLRLGFPASAATVATLLEEPLSAGATTIAADGTIPIDLGAFEIRTLRIAR